MTDHVNHTEVLVMPVSGGRMFGQLGQFQLLSEIEYVPDVVLSCSGGNFAAYVAMAAKWRYQAISRLSLSLTPSLFCTSWSGMGFVDAICGYFSGSIYNSGVGTSQFMNDIFTQESIRSTEIWTGMYNRKKQKFRLACNKSNTILDPTSTNGLLSTYYPKTIDEICKVCIASASIPAIVPPVVINGETYEDGGIAAASPLTFMSESIKKLGKNLHLTYINTFSPTPDDLIDQTLTENLKRATSNLIRSLTVIDVNDAISLLSVFTHEEVKSFTFPCTKHNLEVVKAIKQTIDRTMLEIYPNFEIDVPISSFTKEDIATAMREAYQNSTCCLRWVSTENIQKFLDEIVI